MLALFYFMHLERTCPCKVNLLLNILGKRSDGFHELETVVQPINICDLLAFERIGRRGIELTCSEPSLPTDASNLVYRAAAKFLELTEAKDGIRMHLEKRIPISAGLGGGSSNAANTLLGLNELFGQPLTPTQLEQTAASLGSDVPFFLQSQPALAIGRGERVKSLQPFAAFHGAFILLVHPGFGISTAWAYQNLARFPAALHGRAGRAAKLIALLQGSDLRIAARELYNSLEAPSLEKYPILPLFQDFLRKNGAVAALMSGSGSTTFALFEDRATAEAVEPGFNEKFGKRCWMVCVALN